MQSIIEGIFWFSAATVGYAYAGYPAVIYLLSRCFGRVPTPPVETDLPALSLLIAAHNEEAVLEQRISNALALDYPAEKLEIAIASDGSDDQTVAIARRFGSRVRVLAFPRRRGKAAALNASIPELTGEIVILSDANTQIAPRAARRLARWFSDPRVGAVCGKLVLVDPAEGRNVDSLYWRYETFLKKCEGRLGGLLGANGAIYAIRRDAYQPIPDQTIIDDFAIPLLAKLHSGCSIIYDTSAIGWEQTPRHLRQEFDRRARIGAGGFQAIGMLWPLLDPRRGWIAFTFLSHKIIRWLCPFFLAAALLSSILVSRWALLGQMGFYAAATAIYLSSGKLRMPRLLRLASMFTSMNAALLVGFIRWLRGSQRGTWRPTERSINPPRRAMLPLD
jgi:cellulose synthase/poly-beta-1,6-N-acetylglucosamine synthase-like glycosyltransferase